MFGQLTQELETHELEIGTTINLFCQRREIPFDSSIRVNALAVKESYVLQEGDIVTAIDAVSGGR